METVKRVTQTHIRSYINKYVDIKDLFGSALCS